MDTYTLDEVWEHVTPDVWGCKYAHRPREENVVYAASLMHTRASDQQVLTQRHEYNTMFLPLTDSNGRLIGTGVFEGVTRIAGIAPSECPQTGWVVGRELIDESEVGGMGGF